MQYVFVGGGSVGHLAPLVAVWRELKILEPNATALFVCSTKESDATYLRAEGVSFETLPLPRRSLLLPLTLFRAILRSKRILRRSQPVAVFSKGGAVSVPLCLAAKRRRIPIVHHESDARAGYASRLISRMAKKVCVGFPGAIDNAEYTGNPVRPFVTKGSKEEGLKITGFSGKRPILLVIGGSQGARALNDAVRTLQEELLMMVDIIHVTGQGKTGAPGAHGYRALAFAHKELSHLYATADIALSRAGAGALSELAANGIPTIVCPLRGVAQNHQLINAAQAEKTGGCILLPQERLRSELIPTLENMLRNDNLKTMARAFRSFGKTDAAQRIAILLKDVGVRKQRSKSRN